MFAPSMTALIVAACVSNVLKAVCGVAAGSTRAAISAHLARAGNQADVAAKENSQETFVTLLGLVLGWALAGWAGSDRSVAWCLFLVLTGVHVWANWKGVRALKLSSLNANRADIVIGLTSCILGIVADAEGANSRSQAAPSKTDIGKGNCQGDDDKDEARSEQMQSHSPAECTGSLLDRWGQGSDLGATNLRQESDSQFV